MNDKKYIGVTIHDEYVNRSGVDGEGYKGCSKLWQAIRELGWNKFYHEVLEEIDSPEEAKCAETFYIDLFDSVNSGYNISKNSTLSTPKTIEESTTRSKLNAERRKVRAEKRKNLIEARKLKREKMKELKRIRRENR